MTRTGVKQIPRSQSACLTRANKGRSPAPAAFEYCPSRILQYFRVQEQSILRILDPQRLEISYLREPSEPTGRHFAQCPAEGLAASDSTEAVALI